MELNLLASASVTTLILKHPQTEEPTTVSITGITPDTDEWAKIQKEIVGPNKKQSLIIEKGKQSIELDSDGMEKRESIIRASIRSIDGITEKGMPVVLNQPDVIVEFIAKPQFKWMLEQWAEHLDDRSNFFASAGKPAASGSGASDGSTQTKTD